MTVIWGIWSAKLAEWVEFSTGAVFWTNFRGLAEAQLHQVMTRDGVGDWEIRRINTPGETVGDWTDLDWADSIDWVGGLVDPVDTVSVAAGAV